jgi:Ca-activated chloride channel family protein
MRFVRTPLARFSSPPRSFRFNKHFEFWRGIGVFAAVVCCCAFGVAAPRGQQAIQARTEIVRVAVSVMSPSGDFVGGLTQKDFRVLDRGEQTPVLSFAPDDAPAKVVVMIETSPAVYLIQSQHLAGASALLQGLAPYDQVALVAYDDGPRGLLDFTSDKTAIAAAIGQLQYVLGTGQLNFFISLAAVIDQLAPVTDKKALVLLTTGLDSSPRSNWSALTARLRAQDDVIYPVALGGDLRTAKPDKKKKPEPGEPRNPLSFAQSTADLQALATITGGRAFFPQSQNDFVPAYKQIAAALRHQYVIGIAPQHDGKFHALEVQLVGADGQPITGDVKNPAPRIFAREGYQAPAETSPPTP